MRRVAEQEPGANGSGVPPFWIRLSGNHSSVDERVWNTAKALWPWCYRHVQRRLPDGTVAAQILEDVAIQVLGRLREDDRVGRNLQGYLATSFVREVNAHARRERRILYQGLSYDLECALHPVAADSLSRVEAALLIEALIRQMSPQARRLLYCRLFEYSWKEIATILGITEKQARSRYYYSLQKAADALFGSSTSQNVSKGDRG